MAKLFGRQCRVTIGAQIGALRVGLRVEKHRCAFDVTKTLKPEPNTCTLKVWNLSKDQRAQIEEFKAKNKSVPVLIEAGYEDVQQIFLGDLRTVGSAKEGPDWVTTIESGDGEKALQTSRINVPLGPGTSVDVALNAIVKALGLKPGNAAKLKAQLRKAGAGIILPNGAALSGSAAQHMTNFCRSADLEWSVQDGAIQVLDRGKALSSTALKIDQKSGLIGNATADHKGIMSCKTLMLPDVKPGRLVVLESLAVSGHFKIEKASWSGDTHGADWSIDLEAKRY